MTYLEIVTWIPAPENSTTGLSAGDVLFVGDTTQSFTPNRGVGMPPTAETYPWFVSTGEANALLDGPPPRKGWEDFYKLA